MNYLYSINNVYKLSLFFLLTILIVSCGKPEITVHLEDYSDSMTPEAVKANKEAEALIAEYKAKFGPKKSYKLVVEKNVNIPMRDGTVLKADIFRPQSNEKFPVIMSMTAYMKDRPWPVPKIHEAQQGKYQVWELPDPEMWVPWGYVLVRIDTRGFGQSSSNKPAPLNDQEANDYYDAIEWAARRSWSNGKIGLLGISYIAVNQWYVAAKQPPSLKAIIPWEGLADQYRDTFYRGGILSFPFVVKYMMDFVRDYANRDWQHNQPKGSFSNLDVTAFFYNNLDNNFWKERKADWDKITVPLLSAGNWNGWMGAGHLRGNLEGFKRAASKYKKLRVHTGAHQDAFYSKEGFLDQLRFFDYWLKGIENGVMKEPPVKLAIRYGTGRFEFFWRYENEWPIARTQYKKMYLKVGKHGKNELQMELPQETSSVTYDAPGEYEENDNKAIFISEPFEEDTEITGEIKLNLFVSSTTKDAKVHATLLIIQPTLSPLLHKWFGKREVVTVGWLSAQHRELDPKLTTLSRPYHLHKRLLPLKPGEPTEIQIEIWPTSMVYRKGSRIALILAANHPMTELMSPLTGRYREPHGKNTIYTGGKYASYLQIPVVPPK
jgi:predicted acyl esterase